MLISDETEVLLAVAWATSAEIDKVSRFPEFCSVDVTEKTNLEKRGLFQATFLDGCGGTFIGMRAYLPNSQMSAFNWIYEEAMSHLFGDKTIERIQVVMSDGETALYEPIQSLSLSHTAWKGVKVMRCVYHILVQPLTRIKGACSMSKMKETDISIISDIESMLMKMCFHIKKTYQLDHAMNVLESELKIAMKRGSENVMILLESLWFNSLKPQRHAWACCFKNESMDMLHSTTSTTESMNFSLKHSVSKNSTFAKLSLNESANAIMKHSNEFNSAKER